MTDPAAPTSHPLTLRRPRDGRTTAGNPDDYDVMSSDRAIGREPRSAAGQIRAMGLAAWAIG
jgi:hypothetical protein